MEAVGARLHPSGVDSSTGGRQAFASDSRAPAGQRQLLDPIEEVSQREVSRYNDSQHGVSDNDSGEAVPALFGEYGYAMDDVSAAAVLSSQSCVFPKGNSSMLETECAVKLRSSQGVGEAIPPALPISEPIVFLLVH